MTGSDPRTAEVRKGIRQLALALDDLVDILASANDTSWRDTFMREVEVARQVIALHADDVQRSIADNAAASRKAFVRIHIPDEDPDLGSLDRLYRLRNARAFVVGCFDYILEAAAEIGLRPAGLSVAPTEIEFERAGYEGILIGLEKRLREVEGSLEKLTPADEVGQEVSVQQRGVVNFYIRNMSVELALAKLEATAKAILDFASLARSIDTIGELTRDLVATVRAMPARFTEAVRMGTARVQQRVKSVTRGVRAIVHYVIGRAARSAELQAEAALADSPGSPVKSFQKAMAEGNRAVRDGALTDALTWYHAAMHMALGGPRPGSSMEKQVHLMTCYQLIGDVHLALNYLESAHARYEEALDVAEGLTRRYPEKPEVQRALYDSLDRLARASEQSGDFAAAIIHNERAEAVLDALMKSAPDAKLGDDLANVRARLARLTR